ncbi:hypothetical protein [Paracoccus thiocyanatus]|uniref:Uncharacterized protein n=1 Tax=Paracoccus thiocyanatus TaxID=34006 RepID=A0A3D8PEW6_9RHOB|nr:hypothetical protein [Paracoccus thiocyanatus]RDW14182.1 hypothetical protein DIE28_03850 [Paracoccus thiocyanatus]
MPAGAGPARPLAPDQARPAWRQRAGAAAGERGSAAGQGRAGGADDRRKRGAAWCAKADRQYWFHPQPRALDRPGLDRAQGGGRVVALIALAVLAAGAATLLAWLAGLGLLGLAITYCVSGGTALLCLAWREFRKPGVDDADGGRYPGKGR